MSKLTINIEGADELVAPIAAALSKLTAAIIDASDLLHRLAPPVATSPEIDEPEQPIPPPAVFTSMAEIPWPKRNPGRVARPAKYATEKWTEERVNLLLRLRANGDDWEAIRTAVNKLPGEQIETAHSCRVKFYLLPKDMTRTIVAVNQSGSIASPAKSEPEKTSDAESDRRNKWTGKREALLLHLRTENYNDADILIALNKLPGEKLGNWAIRDRIRRFKNDKAAGEIGKKLAQLPCVQNKPPRRAYIFPKPVQPLPAQQTTLKAPVITASSPPKQGQKITPEVSDVLIARDAAAAMDAPIDWPAALNWARHNKVDIEALGEIDAIKKINQARSNLGLTPWRVIPLRGFPAPLPPPEFGAHGNDYKKPKAGAATA